jgi:hypothetical protein
VVSSHDLTRTINRIKAILRRHNVEQECRRGRGHPLFDECADFVTSRFQYPAYGDLANSAQAGITPVSNNGWPREGCGPNGPSSDPGKSRATRLGQAGGATGQAGGATRCLMNVSISSQVVFKIRLMAN